MRLYELTQNELQLLQMLEEGQDVEDTLQSIQELSTDKLEGYAKIIKTLEGNIAVIQLEEKRLQTNKATLQNGVLRMKKAIQQHMHDTGKQKVDGQLFKFAIQKNPPSLNVVDESLIPKEFFKESAPVLDKKLLMEQLKAGYELTGAQITQGESLRIR